MSFALCRVVLFTCALAFAARAVAEEQSQAADPSVVELAKVKADYERDLKALGDELLDKLGAELEKEKAKGPPERDLEITKRRIGYLEKDREALLERGEWPSSISIAEIKYHWVNDHRGKLREAYRKAQSAAVQRGDESAKKALEDELALFDRTNDLAPWQNLAASAVLGQGEQAWNRVGDIFTCPARGAAGGARNPLRFRRPFPPEHSFRCTIKWIEGEGDVLLGLLDARGHQFELSVPRTSPAKLAPSSAQPPSSAPPSGSAPPPSSAPPSGSAPPPSSAPRSSPAPPSGSTPTSGSSPTSAATAAGDTLHLVVEVQRDRISVTADGRMIHLWTEGQPFPVPADPPGASGPELFVGSSDANTRFKVPSAELKCLARTNPAPASTASTSTAATENRPSVPVSSSASSTSSPPSTPPPSPPEVASRYDKPSVFAALLRGADWLIRHQDKDGEWKLEAYTNACPTELPCRKPGHVYSHDYDPGVTGLATLALWRLWNQSSKSVNKGPIDLERIHAAALAGVASCISRQNADGSFSKGKSFIYNESLATLALAEAYRVTKNRAWKEPAQRAVDFLMRAQRPSPAQPDALWGWRYASRMEVEDPRKVTNNPNYERELHDSDTSATGWAVMALKCAQDAGLEVKKANFDGAFAFVKFITSDNGLVGYIDRETAGQVINGAHDEYVYHPATMSALGACIRLYGQREANDVFLDLAARRIVTDLPSVSRDKLTLDYYYWYCGSVALDQIDGPESATRVGKYWNPWNKALVEALLSLQNTDEGACANGAWLFPDRWSFTGGPLYATAINALTLEDALGWK